MLFCRLLIFFQNQLFRKNLSILPSECQTVWIQIRPDIFVGPDLDPNCLQRLSEDDTMSYVIKSCLYFYMLAQLFHVSFCAILNLTTCVDVLARLNIAISAYFMPNGSIAFYLSLSTSWLINAVCSRVCVGWSSTGNC